MKSEVLITGILATGFIMLILAVGVIITILLARRQKLRQDLQEANYKAKIAEVTLSALSSQMNPHFIFNCLNSIKYFTEQHHHKEASAYLTKFAGLIRATLDNARNDRITLEEEISSIKLYLELEAMRFKEKLSYTIQVDDAVDTEFIELPPMLIQPYIENAIWHGLMPKATGGEISVSIWQDSDIALFIEVSDNGIGRARSYEMQQAGRSEKKSHGTRITGDRIALLNEQYGKKVADVSIIDRIDAGNHPAGTTVIIQLPVK